jgi:hypothetical protein
MIIEIFEHLMPELIDQEAVEKWIKEVQGQI